MEISVTDDLRNTMTVAWPARRIISLIPSITELLFAFDLDNEVIGITKFCIHPPQWFRTKQRVGGTRTVDIAIVRAMKPDLIIAGKEENVKEQMEALTETAPVFVTDIKTLADALNMITAIGKLVNRQVHACKLTSQIQTSFNNFLPLNRKLNTAYFIWRNPYMAAGGDTFIHDMLTLCGFNNIFKHINRYPEVTINSDSHLSSVNLQQATALSTVIQQPSTSISSVNQQMSTALSSNKCQLLLLSSEPYPFGQKHVEELQPQLPGCKIVLVDGEMFSWYGSRLLLSVPYFNKLTKQIQEQ